MNIPLPDDSLQVSNEHLAAALNQAKLGFWEVSLSEGNRMVCTDQCKLNFGRNPFEEFTYQDMLASIVPEDQEAMQAAVLSAINQRVPYFAQYRVKLPDGDIHWIEAQGMVVLNEDDIPQKIVGTTIDITRIKNLEILRDELLSIAMHELNTPLSTVKSSLQILEKYIEKQGDTKILDIATRALNSTGRITRLLNELARPVLTGNQDILLQKTAFDLMPLVNEIIANAVLINKDHHITLTASQNQLFIHADRFRIGQVFTNLVNNAIKYSPGKPDVHIAITCYLDEIIVKVSDQGLGIAPQDRTKVFRKFYRADERQAIDGLGIGLYLCSEIIVRHGGVIGIEDTIGPGTTVYFTLPC